MENNCDRAGREDAMNNECGACTDGRRAHINKDKECWGADETKHSPKYRRIEEWPIASYEAMDEDRMITDTSKSDD